MFLPALALLGTCMAAMQGVYEASLYRYVTTGETGGGIDAELIAGAFEPKRKRS